MDDKQLKTGTTTVALLCKDGIVLAADKRVTSGYLISNKKFEKIFPISESIAVTVAGTVSDIQLLTKYIKAELSLRAIRTGREASVKEAVNLLGMFVYGNIRKYSIIPGVSHFIVAGKDSDGFHSYDISPDGSIIEIDDYTSSGSGSVMAYGVLETLYKPNMSIDEGGCVETSRPTTYASPTYIEEGVIHFTKDGVKKVHSQLLTYKLEA